MKKVMILVLAVMGAVQAHADMMKPATLDLTCTSEGNPVIQIKSKQSGASVTVDGEKILEGEQLIAGTEGGPAYLQAVDGGYNITLSGGDFLRAFDGDLTIAEGEAKANVWTEEKTYVVVCKGLFSF